MFSIVIGLCAIWEIAAPPSIDFTAWTVEQKQLMSFFWGTTLFDTAIYLGLVFLLYKRKFFAFPLALMYMSHVLNNDLMNVKQIITNGFVYPLDNIGAIVDLIDYLLVITGTFWWILKWRWWEK
jgi:hypothetical protein